MPLKIGLDPGHGGKDPGAVGPTGLKEKDVNLAVARELRDLLFWLGYEVVMSREDDRTRGLKWRCDLFNTEKVALAISLHCNASDKPEARYVATYVYGLGGRAEAAAKLIQAAMIKATGWPDGGIKVANLHMLRETRMPAVLVEMGFISNPEQEKMLATPEVQKELALAIACGIHAYFKALGAPPKLPP